MSVTRPPAPPELLKLRTVMNYALETIAATDQWAEVAIDVNRIVRPKYAHQLDDLRKELQAAQEAMRTGSPAAVMFCLAGLLVEVTP